MSTQALQGICRTLGHMHIVIMGCVFVPGQNKLIIRGLDTFLVFSNFLGFWVLSRSAAREASLIYHVYT